MSEANVKILVVDDLEMIRSMIKVSLLSAGYTNITIANDGQQALDKIFEADSSGVPYHLVLSDWNMPKLNGIELLKKVKDKLANHGPKFIMITSESEKKAIIEAISSGATDYVVKPFSKEILLSKVKKVLGT